MTATPPETADAAQIKRMPDGRVGVLDQYGKLVGMHNSHQSALRQLGDYYDAPHAGTNPEMQQAAQMEPMQEQAYEQAGQMAPSAAQPAPGNLDPSAVAGMQAAMHAPTHADLVAGMDFGAALIHQHPHASPQQLVQFAHEMGQQHAQQGLAGYGQGPGMASPMMKTAGALQQAQGKQQAVQAQLQQRQGTMPQMPVIHGTPPAPAAPAQPPVQRQQGMPQMPPVLGPATQRMM